MSAGPFRLFLGGDVMTGRGIDQVLPHPGDPRIFEGYLRSALDYVALAERRNGPIPRPVAPAHVWGDLLAELDARRPDLRIVNLETAVTRGGEPEPKGINYRMHPGNVDVLRAAGIDACVLANNHVLDWGRAGLVETLETLEGAGIGHAGAGRTAAEALAPLVLAVPGKGRVVVVALGSETSGIPPGWAAGPERPGLSLLPPTPGEAVAAVRAAVGPVRRPGDLLVVSVHWGGNWGHAVPDWQRAVGRALVEEAGADIVHGHSSHHPKGVEIVRGRPVLYGCGDLLNDYEGIGGHEAYRGDLVLGWFAEVDPAAGLVALDMVAFRIERFRLRRAGAEEAAFLGEALRRDCARLGGTVTAPAPGCFRLASG